jgi:hypothetical protein
MCLGDDFPWRHHSYATYSVSLRTLRPLNAATYANYFNCGRVKDADSEWFCGTRRFFTVVSFMFIPCILRLVCTPNHTKHTPNLGKSIKLIDIIHHFPYNIFIMFYCILLYFILFVAELHIQPHLPRFYHDTLLYCILFILVIHNFS